MSIYDVITTKSILSWMRVMVANRMANNGKQWVDVFSKYNSGTYNNQVTSARSLMTFIDSYRSGWSWTTSCSSPMRR